MGDEKRSSGDTRWHVYAEDEAGRGAAALERTAGAIWVLSARGRSGPEFVPWLSEQIPYFDLRHMIRPGLTGWAQVRYGYGATLAESREKLEFDLYYIKHMSLGLDLLIMFETVKTIIRRQGAQ